MARRPFKITGGAVGAVAAIVASLCLAGCGGGGSTTATVSTAQFSQQADSICDQAHKGVEREYIAYQKKEGLKEAAPGQAGEEDVLNAIVIPSLQRQAEEIDDLGAPKGEAQKVEALVRSFEDLAEKGESNPLEILSESSYAGIANAARSLGLKKCKQAF